MLRAGAYRRHIESIADRLSSTTGPASTSAGADRRSAPDCASTGAFTSGTFIKVRGGVLVRTEESWTGRQIDSDPATAIKYLGPGLDTWLADLKTTAEGKHH
jgi:hypothetical protein